MICSDNVERFPEVSIRLCLGYENPAQFRSLIREHWSELERHGLVWYGWEPDQLELFPGLFPAKEPRFIEYWLTYEQMLALAMLSSTPRAMEIRCEIVNAFDEEMEAQGKDLEDVMREIGLMKQPPNVSQWIN